MCLSNKDYEKYLNIIGMVKRQIEKHELPFSPKDIYFFFTVDQAIPSMSLSFDYQVRSTLNSNQEKIIKDSDFITLNNKLHDELRKTALFAKRINVKEKTAPYEIKGNLIDENGNAPSIDLNSTDKTLIFAIKSEITICEYMLKEFAKMFKESMKDSKADVKVIIVSMIRLNNEAQFIPKAKIASSKLKELFNDEFYTDKNLFLYFEPLNDPDYDRTLFSFYNKGISLYLYKRSYGGISTNIYEVIPKLIVPLLNSITVSYNDKYLDTINNSLKAIRKIKKNIKNLPYLAEFNAGYNFVLTINDDWTDFVIKEMLTLTMRGQLRTKEFNIVSKAYNDLKIGSSFEVKELKTISFKPQRICSNCNKAIGENDYQYHCYWCNISFCIKCVEDKIKENTNGRQKYLHTKHNLFYFKTKNENDLKDIDEYKLGKNSFAECSERSLSFCHSAICNGCRGSFPSSAIMCQRYICMTCLPGLYRSGGFVDFDFKCISDLRDKKGNFNNINRNNENHDDEHHVYLMLICQVGSYKDY